jgi:hypothetical protein
MMTVSSSYRSALLKSSVVHAVLLVVVVAVMIATTGYCVHYGRGGGIHGGGDPRRLNSPASSPSDDYKNDNKKVEEDDESEVVYTPSRESIVAANGVSGGRIARSIGQIRFNKCPPLQYGNSNTTSLSYAPSRFYANGVHKSVFPLMPADYPISDSKKLTLLTNETKADSVIVNGDFQLFGATADTWLEKVSNHGPYYPTNDPDAPYWDELRHVIKVQIGRRNGDDPSKYSRWPDLWADLDMTGIAKAVQGEYPGSLQQALIAGLFKSGVGT